KSQQVVRDRTVGGGRVGASSNTANSAGIAGTGSGTGGSVAGASVGKPIAVPFRGKSMDKAKHTGKWVVINKDDPEGTQGSEVCHLDRIVLQQAWLCLASDAPGDACLKQCGSVDEFCNRHQRGCGSSTGRREASEDGGSDGGTPGRERGERGTRGSRQQFVAPKSAFGVRPECAWTVSCVNDSEAGKRPGVNGGGGSSTTNRFAIIEGTATRQLQRSETARLVVATNAILEMRKTTESTVVNAQEAFDEGQRSRLACLGQKFLRTFRRERARNWRPNHGKDRLLSVVYGPSSSWGEKEALRRLHEETRQLQTVTANANNMGDMRNPASLEVARTESGASALQAKVRIEHK
ncbi:unnamed protein product, partial [Sphacelaria rigidula]